MDVDELSDASSVKVKVKKEPTSPSRPKTKKTKGSKDWVPPVDNTPTVVVPTDNERPSAAVLEVTGKAWEDYRGMNVSTSMPPRRSLLTLFFDLVRGTLPQLWCLTCRRSPCYGSKWRSMCYVRRRRDGHIRPLQSLHCCQPKLRVGHPSWSRSSTDREQCFCCWRGLSCL